MFKIQKLWIIEVGSLLANSKWLFHQLLHCGPSEARVLTVEERGERPSWHETWPCLTSWIGPGRTCVSCQLPAHSPPFTGDPHSHSSVSVCTILLRHLVSNVKWSPACLEQLPSVLNFGLRRVADVRRSGETRASARVEEWPWGQARVLALLGRRSSPPSWL